MRLSALNAAVIAVAALFASNAQAVSVPQADGATVIYDVNTPTGTESYGFDGAENVNGWGDFITFADVYPRHLTKATFWLSSNIDPTLIPGLTLYIDNNAYGGSWVGNWLNNGSLFEYSFVFSTTHSVPDTIGYLLLLNNPLQQGQILNIATSTTSVGTDVIDGVDLTNGVVLQTIASDPGIYYTYQLDPDLTIAARFEAVPEPATLALLSLGLVGLGYVRRRKSAD